MANGKEIEVSNSAGLGGLDVPVSNRVNARLSRTPRILERAY